ncbi:putative inactive purple acid phosphatase 1, partial [Quercus suber]
PKLVAVSNKVAFVNPNAPVYPRLAQGKVWNEITVTWTSGYGIDEAEPFVEWGPKGGAQVRSPAGTLTFDRNTMCDFQPASLNTTKQLIEDLNDIDIVFHIGDIVYAMGYIAQWDQFIAQIEPIASTKPYMIGSGNHECVWPGTGSFYQNMDSGGECGVLAEKKFYVPAENRANFWYSTDYGMFQFCIAHTELDWRGRSEQYKFIENCLASVDRQRQPWLIFLAQSTRLFFCGLLCGRRVI